MSTPQLENTNPSLIKDWLGLPPEKRKGPPKAPPYNVFNPKPDDPHFMYKVIKLLMESNIKKLLADGFLDLDSMFQTSTHTTIIAIRDALLKIAPPIKSPFCGRFLFMTKIATQKVELPEKKFVWRTKFYGDDKTDNNRSSQMLEFYLFSGRWYWDRSFDYLTLWPADLQRQIREDVKGSMREKYKGKLPSEQDLTAFIEKELTNEVEKYFDENYESLYAKHKAVLEEHIKENENTTVQLYVKLPKELDEQIAQVITAYNKVEFESSEWGAVDATKCRSALITQFPSIYKSKSTGKISVNCEADDILFFYPPTTQ